MKITIKESLNNRKLLLILSSFTMLFFAMAALFGDLFSAIAGAFLSIIFLLDRGKYICSLSVSLIGIVIDVLISGWIPFASIETVFIALILSILFSRGVEKSFLSAIITVTVSAFVVLYYVFLAMQTTGDYSFAGLKTFFEALYEELKSNFITAVNEMLSTLPEMYNEFVEVMTDTEISLMFDSLVSGLISVVVIYAFLISGIAIKLFSKIIFAISVDPGKFESWRFTTSNVFCYFYIVLFFAVTFVTGNDIWTIAIANLYNIFLAVYAYIGLRAEYRLLRSKLSAALTLIIVIGQFVVLSFIVLQVLSIFGVLGTISKNKMSGISNPPDDNAL